MRIHAGSLPYRCNYCSKSFADPSILRRHVRGHLGMSRYECLYCTRRFDLKLVLDMHMTKYHKDAATLPKLSHLCPVCGSAFLKSFQLRAHLKFHDKSVTCSNSGCTLKFRYSSEMRLHTRTHTDERAYLCDTCGYAGKSKNQLTRHRRIHTGTYTYRLSYMHLTFTRSNILLIIRNII